MEKHVNIVAALQIGMSIFVAIIGIFGFVILSIIGNISNDKDAEIVLKIIAYIAISFFFVLSIPGIIAGLGLFKKKEWARILTLVLSAIHLFNVPIGTAFGAYSIWALVQDETVALFKNQNTGNL